MSKLPVIEQILVDHNLNILFLSETWFHHSLLDAVLTLDGYTLFRRDRHNAVYSSMGGGVAVYLRSSLATYFSRCSHLESPCLEDICLLYHKFNSPASPLCSFHLFYRPRIPKRPNVKHFSMLSMPLSADTLTTPITPSC